MLSADRYSSFRISANGTSHRQWCTVGCPLWSSLGLLDRSTVTVWTVVVNEEGITSDWASQTMKITWHDPMRPSAAEIYLSLQGEHPQGHAGFLTGGDVVTATGETITTALLHGKVIDNALVRHRVILNTIGRPLWAYTSDLELLKGMHAAGSAHKFISDQNFIHRDINTGNILLAKNPNSGRERVAGFLSDLEFAQSPGPVPSTKETTTVLHIEKAPGVWTEEAQHSRSWYMLDKHGTDFSITGTLQFMAYDLLIAIQDRVQVQRAAEHGVESFIYVLGFTVLRKLLTDAKVQGDREILNKYFTKAVGPISLETIISSRNSCDALAWVGEARLAHIVKRELSPILINLLAFFNHCVQTQIMLKEWKKRKADFDFTGFQDPTSAYSDVSQGATTLTHEFLLNNLSTAIKKLETGAM